MIGSKRLSAMEQEVFILRQTLERQAERIDAIEAARATDAASVHTLQYRLDEALDALQAQLDRNTAKMKELSTLTGAAEQSRQAALERKLAKLELRLAAQLDEAHVTATALLQRIEFAGPSRLRVD